jgi:hypothetical protein
MKRLAILLALAIPVLSTSPCACQSNFFSKWENRVRSTTGKQPGWAVPVVTSTSGIVQLVRPEFVRQYTSTHFLTRNYGNSKGVDFIPYYNTEIDLNLPPYIQHNNPKVHDGAGDFSMIAKYRPFSGNEKHGNYSTAFQLAATGATGSYKNGLPRNTFTPTVVGGKGFGNFDVQSSIGGNLPVGSVHTIGRTILWNTVAQYRVGKIFWPELEVNSSFYHLGPNDGKNQTFITPGLMVSKIKLRHDPKDRLAFIFGTGMQIATSSYHAYNHSLIITTRIAF